MRTINRILICGGVFCLAASAQTKGPGDLTLPTGGGRRRTPPVDNAASAPMFAPAPIPAGGCEVVAKGLYKVCREGAIAALRAGNDAANNVKPNRDRATGFYLLSIDREPAYARALFNLGVMCAKSNPGRWDDAVRFYHEAARLDASPELAALLAKEIPRVEAILRLESTPEGHKQRTFDLDLNDLIPRFNDPPVALDRATKLMKSDPGRWEGPAAVGILQAALSHYEESATALDAAAKLAPSDSRAKLFAASALAKNEGQYMKGLAQGDTAFESKDYEKAGGYYADAWQASPGRVDTGMKAAISFLMADRVPLAVQILARIRQLKDPELSQKAGSMLQELGAISADAKAAAAAQGSSDVEASFDVAERIRTEIGELRNAEVLLVSAPAPALIGDDTKFLQLNDDEINHPKEEYQSTSESLFGIYLSRVGDRRVGQSDSSPSPAPETVSPEPPAFSAPAAPARPQPFGARTVAPGTLSVP